MFECPACDTIHEDEGLCVKCWDEAAGSSGRIAVLIRGRRRRKLHNAIQRMIGEGYSRKDVQARLNVSERTICRALGQAEPVAEPPPTVLFDFQTPRIQAIVADVYAEYGLTPAILRERLSKRNREGLVALVKRLRAENLTWKQIALYTGGRERTTLWHHFNKC